MATGPSEAEPFWTAFLRGLADRGLRGVKLIVSDDHKGLRAAADKVLHATMQRCRVHYADLRIMPTSACALAPAVMNAAMKAA
jgi:transposase-like protein